MANNFASCVSLSLGFWLFLITSLAIILCFLLSSYIFFDLFLTKKINNIKNSKVVVEDHEELKTQLKIKNNKLMAENEELKEKVKMMKLTKEEKLKEPHDNESRLEEMKETINNWLESNNRALESYLEEMWKSISNWLESLESRLEEMRESISIRALEENLNKLKVELNMKYEEVTEIVKSKNEKTINSSLTETECSQHEQQRTLRELKAEKDAMVKRVANLEKLCEQLILKKANVEDVKGVEDKVEIVLDLFNKEIMANNDYDYDKCSIDDCSYCRNGGRRSPCQIDDDFYQYDRVLVPR